MTSAHDEKLVRRAQKGNQAAFAELFTCYEGRIFGYLYRMVGDRAWAEDLAQEAFIQAHQNLGRLGPPYDFKSWVYRIAGNLALDGLRRYRDTVTLPDWDGGEATAPEPSDQRRESDPEDQAGLAEVRDAVWRTIHHLPDNYRQALILREIDGLSYNEIADVLGISLDNVRVTLHRARLQFRDLYGIQVMVTEGRLACQELDDLLLSAYVDGEMDQAGRRRVKTHIETCPACQKKRRDLLAVSGLLAAVAPVFPPPSLQARFLTRLRHLPPPEPPPVSGSGGPSTGRGGGFFEGGPPPWLLMTIGGGGAILLIAAVVLGLLTLPHLGPYLGAFSPTDTPVPPPPSLTPTALPTSAPAATSAPPSPTLTPTPTSTPVPPTPTPTPPTPTPIPPTATPPPPPPPPPTPTPLPTPTPYIAFWAEANVVPAGTCTTVRWQTAHVQAVFFNGQGVPGAGSHQTCPCANETHTLDVTLPDGSHDVRHVTIHVNGTCITPTPDIQGPPAPVPGYPTGSTVLSCRASATLSWKAVSDPSGVAGYHVRLEKRLQNETWGPVGEWGPLPGTQLDVPVSCGLLYRWAVRAEDELGNLGPWSRWMQFGIGID